MAASAKNAVRKLRDVYSGLSVQVKASAWFFVCSVLQKGVSVITTPIFTRLLSTAEYGQYTVFNSWLSVITVIVTLQLASGVYTMGLVKFKDEARVFSSSLQGLNLVLCTAWTVIYLLLHDFWNNLLGLTTVQMLAMLSMIWTSSTFHFWMTEQRNAFKYKLLVAVTFVVSVAKPVVGVLCVMAAEDKVTARILGLMVVELAGYSWCFFVQMRRGKVFCSKKYWKYAIIFNLPLIPHYLSNTVLASADRIMIQNMVSSSAAGIYGLAYSVSQIMQMVNDSLNKTMSPWLYQKIGAKDYGNMAKAVYPSLVIIAGANLLLIAVAPEAVAIFATADYYDAIYVIPPVAMSVYVQYLYLCFAPFEFYYEKRIWTTVGTLTAAVANLVLNWLLIPVFGYYAAGYTTLLCYSINSLMHYFFMQRVCREELGGEVRAYDPKILLGITLAFMAVGFCYIPLYSNTVLRYAFTVLLLAIAFWQRGRIIPAVKQMMGSKKKANA